MGRNPERKPSFMNDEWETHSDGYGCGGHPAINVKYYGRYHPAPEGCDEEEWDQIGEVAFEGIAYQWWEDATELAHEAGYSGVFQEGRSGGWLVPYYQGYPPRKIDNGCWPGQGGNLGYPRFPECGDPDEGPRGADEFGERARFLSFQRKIKKLLESVEDDLQEECLEIWRERQEERREAAERATVKYGGGEVFPELGFGLAERAY